MENRLYPSVIEFVRAKSFRKFKIVGQIVRGRIGQGKCFFSPRIPGHDAANGYISLGPGAQHPPAVESFYRDRLGVGLPSRWQCELNISGPDVDELDTVQTQPADQDVYMSSEISRPSVEARVPDLCQDIAPHGVNRTMALEAGNVARSRRGKHNVVLGVPSDLPSYPSDPLSSPNALPSPRSDLPSSTDVATSQEDARVIRVQVVDLDQGRPARPLHRVAPHANLYTAYHTSGIVHDNDHP